MLAASFSRASSSRLMRVATFSSIWVRLRSSSWFSRRRPVLSWRRASTSVVMAATLAVRVLMVSAGVSASGAGALGTLPITAASSEPWEQDFRPTKTSISSTAPARTGRSRLLVATATGCDTQSEAAKGRVEIRYRAVVSDSSPLGSSRLCWKAAVSQSPRRVRGSRVRAWSVRLLSFTAVR